MFSSGNRDTGYSNSHSKIKDHSLYDQTNLQFRRDDYPPTDDEDDPVIADNQLSRALIDLWQPNPEPTSLEETQGYQYEETNSIIDEKALLHILVAKPGEPSYVPFSKNLGLKDKRRMLFLLIDFGELTIDGLIDTGSLSSAIPEGDLRNLRLLAPQPIVKERPAPTFQFVVANGQVETPESPVDLTFEVRDIEFHELFIVIEKLTGRI